jgi:hypothetical protein
MSKARASYYIRFHEIIVSATSTLDAPDSLDDLRCQVTRGFMDALSFTALDDDEMDEAEPSPSGADLPPLD